ncbi:hypothetical protein QQ045_010979 [Rhodiola kirilowii]
MFANDVIIFAKALPRSLVRIKEALNTFRNWSGLIISEEKSAIYFGGCSESEESLLASGASFHRGQLPFNYLGVPLQGKRLKGTDFNVIIDKMTSKIKAWSSRLLSYAGRLVLIKHVLSSIGSYWMRVMIFTKSVIKKISTICRNFLWSGAVSRKRNLVAWTENVLAHPKHSFCAWLAVRDRLPTRARLQGSLIGDRRCCWCSEVEEDGVHLFFQCKVSPPIHSFLDLIGLRMRWSSWDEMITWSASKRWSCRSQKLVAFFIITSAIYEVWRARNRCIFEGDSDSVEAVRTVIWRMLKLKLELIKNSKTGFLCASWCSNTLANYLTNV